MKNTTVIDHPLIEHNLVRLRDEKTEPEEFRRALGEIATLMVYEATRNFEQKSVTVQTPVAKTRAKQLKREVLLVPVLRAGLGMLEPLLRLIPHARVGFIGLKRNEDTLEAATYHKSLPERLGKFEIIVIDPMLATGGSAVSAIQLLHERGAKRVRLVNVLAAPEGVKYVHKHFPEVPIFTGAMDKKLNEKGYIVPGLGDAGDRLFGV
ncbi:MAG: uracil phosphoribosyltransferase [Verrucomicrobiia bacterium]|jgi:uracil phosphoribosyltransferase